MKVLSAKQYAEEVGVTVSYITKIIKASSTLPQTSRVEKYGNTWRITLSKNFNSDTAKATLKTLLKTKQ